MPWTLRNAADFTSRVLFPTSNQRCWNTRLSFVIIVFINTWLVLIYWVAQKTRPLYIFACNKWMHLPNFMVFLHTYKLHAATKILKFGRCIHLLQAKVYKWRRLIWRTLYVLMHTCTYVSGTLKNWSIVLHGTRVDPQPPVTGSRRRLDPGQCM